MRSNLSDISQLENLASAHHWHEALFLAARLRAGGGLDAAGRVRVAAAIADWGTVLDIAGFCPQVVPPVDLAPSVIVPFATGLIELGFLVQGQQFAQTHGLRELEARALVDMGRSAEAVVVETDRLAAGDITALPAVVSLLLKQGQFDACGDFLAAQDLAGDQREQGLQGMMMLAQARGEPDLALGYLNDMRDLAGRVRGDHMRTQSLFAMRNRRDDLQAEAMAALAGWADDPATHFDLVEHGPVILRNQCHFDVKSPKLIGLVAVLETLALPKTAALVLRDVLMQIGDYDRAVGVVERSIVAFPASVPLWREALRLRARMSQPEHCADLRRRMFKALPEQAALDALCHNHTGAWDWDDLPRMIRHGYTTPTFRVRDVFKAAVQRVPVLSRAALLALNDQKAHVDAIDGQAIVLLGAQHGQRHVLNDGDVTPVPFARFQAMNRDLQADLVQGRRKIAALKVVDNPGRALIVQSIQALTQAQGRGGDWRYNSAETLVDAVGVARALIGRIAQGTPTSVIRLGDGEGHYLPFDATLDSQLAQDQRAMQILWWNRQFADGDSQARITGDFRAAVGRADVLGLVPESRLLRIYQTKGKLVTSNRGVARVMGYGADHLRPDQVVVSTQFQRDLMDWDLWDDIFAAIPESGPESGLLSGGQRRLSWISPHDLTGFLKDRFDVHSRIGRRIPGEAKYVGMFDPATVVAGTLLDQHDAVLADLHPEPGEVWLVAAGFLGKIYCDRIRALGGIAIDIGSLADDWMGYATRVVRADPKKRVPLSDRGVTGMGFGI